MYFEASWQSQSVYPWVCPEEEQEYQLQFLCRQADPDLRICIVKLLTGL